MKIDQTVNTDNEFEKQLISALPILRQTAFCLTASKADSEDLVQFTVQRGIEKQAQCRDSERVQGWLLSILRSSWKNEIRSRQVRQGNGTIDAEHLAQPDDSKQPDANFAQAEIREQVYKLSEDFRSVLLLVDYFGLSYSETADRLDLKMGTVMSRLSRARQKLINECRHSPDVNQ